MFLCENTCCLKYTLPPIFSHLSCNSFVLWSEMVHQNQNFFDYISHRDNINKCNDKDYLGYKILKSQYILGCERCF